MRWLKIIFTVLVVCVFLALLAPFAFISGCIAAGDKLAELPPLRIKGKLMRPGGQAVAGETVGLGLSTMLYDHGPKNGSQTWERHAPAWQTMQIAPVRESNNTHLNSDGTVFFDDLCDTNLTTRGERNYRFQGEGYECGSG